MHVERPTVAHHFHAFGFVDSSIEDLEAELQEVPDGDPITGEVTISSTSDPNRNFWSCPFVEDKTAGKYKLIVRDANDRSECADRSGKNFG